MHSTYIHSHPNGDKAGNSDATMKANIMSFQYDFNLPIPQFSIYYQPEKKYLKYWIMKKIIYLLLLLFALNIYGQDEKIIKQLIEKGLKIENVDIRNGQFKTLKPFVRENKGGKKLDPELAIEIQKVKVKNKGARVKPGYKKKMQQEIDKLKRKHKRKIIKKSIEEQRKKSYKPGGKNYHE